MYDSQKYVSLLKSYALPLSIGVAGLLFFGYGLIQSGEKSFGSAQDKKDILFEAASDVNPTALAKQNAQTKTVSVTPGYKEIVVDVAGAVLKPGVYKLKENSRIQDALIAAGGMSEEADRAKVAKNVNLASKVSDGAKIYIPWQGEEATPASGVSGGDALSDSVENVVNINEATQAELEELPGVGEVTAKKIMNARPYQAIEELVDKKIVGQSVFDKIKDKIKI